nr:glycosyltransferase [Bacteroidota bacterium]
MIPGYKEDQVIYHVAEDALNQNYPSGLYDVVVIADSFQKETIERLNQLPIKVIEVSFDVSTKSKALNRAMEVLKDDYDGVIILDADNLMESDFITKINESYCQGYIAIQGHRVAKNTDTSFAILDAISEEINNHIYRKGHRVVGLSAALIGSGMAFDYSYFKKTMQEIKAIGGFDKELELKLTREGTPIEYIEPALVYDEKIQSGQGFSNQRRRWLSAQFVYFSRSIGNACWALMRRGNVENINKSMQFVQLPRIILLGVLVIVFVISLIFGSVLHYKIWGILLALCALALLMGVPGKFYNTKTLVALLSLPRGFLLMILSLLRIRGANKRFIHTEHSSVDHTVKKEQKK